MLDNKDLERWIYPLLEISFGGLKFLLNEWEVFDAYKLLVGFSVFFFGS